ncbi:MAG: hypothetical protein ACYDGR_02715 [Candidatus Dormibacteria bacterium]
MSFLRRWLGGGQRPAGLAADAGTNDQRLRGECERCADGVLKYLQGRGKKQPNPTPPTRDPDLQRAADRAFSQYQMDTMTDYGVRYKTDLVRLAALLAERGVGDEELVRLAERPANPAGAQRAAELLRACARRLDPEIARLEEIYTAPGAEGE